MQAEVGCMVDVSLWVLLLLLLLLLGEALFVAGAIVGQAVCDPPPSCCCCCCSAAASALGGCEPVKLQLKRFSSTLGPRFVVTMQTHSPAVLRRARPCADSAHNTQN